MGGVEGVDENKVLIDEILNNKKFVGGKYTKEQVVRDIRTKASLIIWSPVGIRTGCWAHKNKALSVTLRFGIWLLVTLMSQAVGDCEHRLHAQQMKGTRASEPEPAPVSLHPR